MRWRRSAAATSTAARKLREAARALREHDGGDERMQEEAADLEAMAERYRHHRVEEADRKYMHQRAYAADPRPRPVGRADPA
jgi:DNA-binding transcriptional regulator GbsR (MarR family)